MSAGQQTGETVAVPADKLRAGDVVALASGLTPYHKVAVAEYHGHRNGCNCVRIGFEQDGGVRFMPTPGWRQSGVFAAWKSFYVAPEAAEAIRARRTAMDEFYAAAEAGR